MGGVVTNSRDLSRSVVVRTFGGSSIPPIRLYDAQETTSYRSGGEVSQDATLLQDAQIFGSPRHLARPYDTGHEFQTIRSRFIHTSQPVFESRFDGTLERIGPLILSNGPRLDGSAWVPEIPRMSTNDQIKYGQRAIAATAPTKPDAGLFAMTGEVVRDGIPSMIGHVLFKQKDLRSIGSEYLNVEFGWKPLISDLVKLMRAVKRSSQTVAQMKRDNGRIVRRRFSFPEQTSLIEGEIPRDGAYGLFVNFASATVNNTSPITYQDSVQERIWFSGAFTYYLPTNDALVSRFTRYEALANKVLGTRLTPSVLYQLAPWSWLLDWFADFGTVFEVHSLLDNDSLVIRWGYLMRRTDVFRTITVDAQFTPRVNSGQRLTVVNTFRSTRKERWRASPYGFSVNSDQFSGRQWAILGALGMTKAPRVSF